MGITRDSMHKRRNTGAKRVSIRKARKFEMGRPPAMTKLGPKRVHEVRARGGNLKHRALRLDHGNFGWATECCTRPTRILDVCYNASNNELLRTKTLVKNCIVQIDASPFRSWYEAHYGVKLATRRSAPVEADKEEVSKSGHVKAKLAARQKNRKLASALEEQFAAGRLYACISSRPGQTGRADGYILEGDELAFYKKKIDRKGKK